MSNVIVCFWLNAYTWRYSSRYLILINFLQWDNKTDTCISEAQNPTTSHVPVFQIRARAQQHLKQKWREWNLGTDLANSAISQNVNAMLLLALGSNLLDTNVALLHSKRFAAEASSPSLPTQYHVHFTDDHTMNITGTTDGSGETFTLHAGASGLPFMVFHAKSIN